MVDRSNNSFAPSASGWARKQRMRLKMTIDEKTPKPLVGTAREQHVPVARDPSQLLLRDHVQRMLEWLADSFANEREQEPLGKAAGLHALGRLDQGFVPQ